MIWYLIGGLIGIFFFKKKFHLSTWSAIGYGISLTLCVYFGVGAIAGFIASSTGIDEIASPWVYGLLFLVFLVVFIINIRRLRNHSTTNDPDTSGSIESRKTSDIKIQEGRKFRKCPYCAEYILEEAVYCRYCKHDLRPSQTPITRSVSSPINQTMNKNENSLVEPAPLKERDNTWIVLLIFILLPVVGLTIWGTSSKNENNNLSVPQVQNALPSSSPTNPQMINDSCYIRRKNDNSQMVIIGPDVDDICKSLIQVNPEVFYLVEGPIDAEKICEVSVNEYKVVVRDISSSNSVSSDLCGFLKNNKSIGQVKLFSQLSTYLANLDSNNPSIYGCKQWSDVTINDIGKTLCVYGSVRNSYFDSNQNGYFITFSSDPRAIYFVSYSGKDYGDLIGKCAMFTGKVDQVWDTPLMQIGENDILHDCEGTPTGKVTNHPTTGNSVSSNISPTSVTINNPSPTQTNSPNIDKSEITIKTSNRCETTVTVYFTGVMNLKFVVPPGQTVEMQAARGTYTITDTFGNSWVQDLSVAVWEKTYCQ